MSRGMCLESRKLDVARKGWRARDWYGFLEHRERRGASDRLARTLFEVIFGWSVSGDQIGRVGRVGGVDTDRLLPLQGP